MFSEAKVAEFYCLADDFCKEFAKYQEYHIRLIITNQTNIIIINHSLLMSS